MPKYPSPPVSGSMAARYPGPEQLQLQSTQSRGDHYEEPPLLESDRRNPHIPLDVPGIAASATASGAEIASPQDIQLPLSPLSILPRRSTRTAQLRLASSLTTQEPLPGQERSDRERREEFKRLLLDTAQIWDVTYDSILPPHIRPLDPDTRADIPPEQWDLEFVHGLNRLAHLNHFHAQCMALLEYVLDLRGNYYDFWVTLTDINACIHTFSHTPNMYDLDSSSETSMPEEDKRCAGGSIHDRIVSEFAERMNKTQEGGLMPVSLADSHNNAPISVSARPSRKRGRPREYGDYYSENDDRDCKVARRNQNLWIGAGKRPVCHTAVPTPRVLGKGKYQDNSLSASGDESPHASPNNAGPDIHHYDNADAGPSSDEVDTDVPQPTVLPPTGSSRQVAAQAVSQPTNILDISSNLNMPKDLTEDEQIRLMQIRMKGAREIELKRMATEAKHLATAREHAATAAHFAAAELTHDSRHAQVELEFRIAALEFRKARRREEA
ncbi:hypothetical protein P154DRAFT_579082 [Amniculicola lignicola CBS 123094]|uniref:Uncharacterized protein n=1 Tax=Amniculicola lignicola CBS 123094 TaxID=1392246 RepID=A0A6A5W914_9PLEO|nr:hypothetical protein P154DRAFT_579082 [Amniculicola lignicola CBS 123094]